MNPKRIRASSDYELLDREDLPCPEVWREKATGNLLFIAPDRRGRERVLDQYVVLRDYGCGVLRYEKRESGPRLRHLRDIFEGAAGLLIFLSDKRLKTILAVLGIDPAPIARFIQKVGTKIDAEKLEALVLELGGLDLESIRASIVEAIKDGVFSAEEYKKIQALCREARR